MGKWKGKGRLKKDIMIGLIEYKAGKIFTITHGYREPYSVVINGIKWDISKEYIELLVSN